MEDEKQVGVFSITFGDCAENNIGMQKLGSLAKEGFTTEELNLWKEKLGEENCELIDLEEKLPEELRKEFGKGKSLKASVLVVRKGVELLLGASKEEEMLGEMRKIPLDKKALMRGKVKNKNARWNCCFGEEAQEAQLEKGKGTVVAFSQVPILASLRQKLGDIFGEKAKNLLAELNYYLIPLHQLFFQGFYSREVSNPPEFWPREWWEKCSNPPENDGRAQIPLKKKNCFFFFWQ